MKFGKSLSNQIEETLPDWRDKFLSYKDLKKRLKRIPAVNNNGNSNKRIKVGVDDVTSTTSSLSGSSAVVPDWTAITSLTEEEANFMSRLQAELDKFNSFFLEKEEEYVIRQKELQDRMAAAVGDDDDFKEQGAAVDEELMKIQKEIVDFHGEMVLLENYSALNYTGLVKILKKYDKRTGALLRLPFIQNVLQQPFFMTDLLYKLIKECESMLDRLFPVANNVSSTLSVDLEDKPLQQQLINGDRGSTETSASSSLLPKRKGVDLRIPELDEIEYMESVYLKSTVSALRVLKEIRKGSSTVGVFSLPPLQQATGNMDEDRRWSSSLTSPVLEQAAK